MLRSSRTALVATLLCAAGLVATVLAVRFLAPVQARDVLAFDSFRRLDGPASSGPLRLIASVGDPLLYVVLGLTAAAVAWARGRQRIALAIPVLLLATGATTQLLKVVLDEGTLKPGSFPSGHATAALTLALCAALAAPARLRPTVIAAGAGLAAAVSYAIVSLGWHSPSDILGGFLVAATLTGAAGVVLLRGEERRGETPPARAVTAPRRPLGSRARGCRGHRGRRRADVDPRRRARGRRSGAHDGHGRRGGHRRARGDAARRVRADRALTPSGARARRPRARARNAARARRGRRTFR